MTGLFDEGAGDLDSDAFQVKLDNTGFEMSFGAQRDASMGRCACFPNNRSCYRSAKARGQQAALRPGGGRPHPRPDFCDIIANELDPETIAQRKWRRAIYGTHPYSRPDEGTKVSLAGIPPADLGAFHQTTFARDGLHVAVVGDIDAKTVSDKLDQLFGDCARSRRSLPLPMSLQNSDSRWR